MNSGLLQGNPGFPGYPGLSVRFKASLYSTLWIFPVLLLNHDTLLKPRVKMELKDPLEKEGLKDTEDGR